MLAAFGTSGLQNLSEISRTVLALTRERNLDNTSIGGNWSCRAGLGPSLLQRRWLACGPYQCPVEPGKHKQDDLVSSSVSSKQHLHRGRSIMGAGRLRPSLLRQDHPPDNPSGPSIATWQAVPVAASPVSKGQIALTQEDITTIVLS